jgi:hypothetical protein
MRPTTCCRSRQSISFRSSARRASRAPSSTTREISSSSSRRSVTPSTASCARSSRPITPTSRATRTRSSRVSTASIASSCRAGARSILSSWCGQSGAWLALWSYIAPADCHLSLSVAQNNLFPPHRDIHETFDLKGSSVGREYPEDKAREKPGAVLKDINWVRRDRSLQLGPEKAALLAEQLRRDAEFLKSAHIMDHSLLIGIHRFSGEGTQKTIAAPSVEVRRHCHSNLPRVAASDSHFSL